MYGAAVPSRRRTPHTLSTWAVLFNLTLLEQKAVTPLHLPILAYTYCANSGLVHCCARSLLEWCWDWSTGWWLPIYKQHCFLLAAATVIFGRFWSILLQEAHATYIAEAEGKNWGPNIILAPSERAVSLFLFQNWWPALNSGKLAASSKQICNRKGNNMELHWPSISETGPPPESNRLFWGLKTLWKRLPHIYKFTQKNGQKQNPQKRSQIHFPGLRALRLAIWTTYFVFLPIFFQGSWSYFLDRFLDKFYLFPL